MLKKYVNYEKKVYKILKRHFGIRNHDELEDRCNELLEWMVNNNIPTDKGLKGVPLEQKPKVFEYFMLTHFLRALLFIV